ncbi:MAG: PLD nuclease N-terminal domain-containing protein [Bacteroidota bacterium]
MARLRLLPALLLGALALTLTGCAEGNLGGMVMSGPGGLCGLIHLIVAIWALVQIANSSESTGSKVLWGALVFFFPLGGLILWWLFGPRS